MRAVGISRLMAFYFGMAFVAVLALWGAEHPAQLFPPLDELGSWLKHAGLGLGVGLAVVLVSRLITTYFEWAATLATEFRSMLGNLNHREIAVAALLSGVGEELLFRGVLQPALGLWIAAAIFGVLHIGPNRRFIPWTVMAFGAGLLFGVMFESTGNLLAPILAHITINFLNLRHLTLAESEGEVQLASA